MKISYCLMGMLLLIISVLQGQPASRTIKGIVIDAYTKKPLQNAFMSAKANARANYTGYKGEYDITITKDDSFFVSHDGYHKKVLPVKLSDKSSFLLIELTSTTPPATTPQEKRIDVKKNPVKPLNIGDSVPDLLLTNLLNYKSNIARLSDFKGKVIVIDFFATWCAGCVAAIPKLDSLQKLEGDKFQLLVVSDEPATKLTAFLKKRPNQLVYMAKDSLLGKLFPHRLIPHEVWIGTDGRVKAFTPGEYVTEANISEVASGAKINWPVKKDILEREKAASAFKGDNTPLYYSAIFPYRPGTGSSSGTDSLPQGSFTRMVNLPIVKMYTIAWGKILNWQPNRLLLQVKDSSGFLYDAKNGFKDQWNKSNSYCYEAVQPFTLKGVQKRKAMQADLDRFFGLYGRMEKRMVPCWVLEKTQADLTALVSTHTEFLNTFTTADSIKQLLHATLESLIFHIDKKSPIPVIDETGFTGLIDLAIKFDVTPDMRHVNDELKRYGLQLKKAERELEMLVITEP